MHTIPKTGINCIGQYKCVCVSSELAGRDAVPFKQGRGEQVDETPNLPHFKNTPKYTLFMLTTAFITSIYGT